MLRFNVVISSSFVAITKCGILKHCGIHGCPLTGTAQLRPKRILLPLVINVVKAIPENWFLTKVTFLRACTDVLFVLTYYLEKKSINPGGMVKSTLDLQKGALRSSSTSKV